MMPTSDWSPLASYGEEGSDEFIAASRMLHRRHKEGLLDGREPPEGNQMRRTRHRGLA
jgi:hypothetical protein